MRSSFDGRFERRPPLRATFIVRMWRDAERPDAQAWRGTVEHVQAGERRAVADTDGLLHVLSAWLLEETEEGRSRTSGL